MWTCIKSVTNIFLLLKQFLCSYVRLNPPASQVEKRSPSSRFTRKKKRHTFRRSSMQNLFFPLFMFACHNVVILIVICVMIFLTFVLCIIYCSSFLAHCVIYFLFGWYSTLHIVHFLCVYHSCESKTACLNMSLFYSILSRCTSFLFNAAVCIISVNTKLHTRPVYLLF